MRTIYIRGASFVVEDIVAKLKSLGKEVIDYRDIMHVTCLDQWHAARLLTKLEEVGVIEEIGDKKCRKRNTKRIFRLKV
ncbi:MAG: hypothetical protein DRO13_05615 [Thermoprotei archaeon]|nr:MAG: hypothetical protein DRO13_05615 [Thermoprotei archaeon]